MPLCTPLTTPVGTVDEALEPDRRDALGDISIRLLEPAEDLPLRRVFAGLSLRSRYLRYQRSAPTLSASMVRALVDLRPGFHVALAAEAGGEPVGIVRWIRHDTGTFHAGSAHAEIAVEVIDDQQGRGIGSRLTMAAARSALEAGIEYFTFWVHRDHGGLRDRLLLLGAQQAADDPDHFRLHPAALLSSPGGSNAGGAGGPGTADR